MKLRVTAIAALAAIITAGGSAGLLAQVAGTETIDVPVGSIFEIQAVPSTGSQFSWVLTRGEEFVEASRSSVFHTRFTQPGNFRLAGQVGNEDGSIVATRTFDVNVRPRLPEDTAPLPANAESLVAFTPALVENTLYLPEGKDVALAVYARDDISIIAMDFDATSDSNGDGNPMNDDETRDTLFRSDGNPLYLWFTNRNEREIKVGALLSDNSTKIQSIPVRSGEAPAGTPAEPTDNDGGTITGGIQVISSDNGTLQFAIDPEMEDGNPGPKLYQWNFGDGNQSLLDHPVHTFAEGGDYHVTVVVRDLSTGQTLMTLEDDIVVNRLRDDLEPGETGDTAAEDNDEDQSSGGGSMIWTIIKILFVLLLSAVLGAGAIFAIGKMKKGFSLQKTLDKAEQKLVPPNPARSEPAPLSMEMPAEDEVPPPTEEADAPIAPAGSTAAQTENWLQPQEPIDVTPVSAPAPAPAAQTAPVPDWLSNAPTEAPSPVTPAPTASTPPAHAPLEPSAEQLTMNTTNAPSWLKSGIEAAASQGQTPAAPPPPDLTGNVPAEVPLTTPVTPVEEPATVPVAPPPPVTPAPAPVVPAPAAPTPTPVPAAPAPAAPREPAPAPVAPVAAPTPSAATAPTAALDPEREAKLREKKRLKRQRYRENRKRRDQEQAAAGAPPQTNAEPADDETVAIIRAEDVTPPPPPAPKAPNEEPPHS